MTTQKWTRLEGDRDRPTVIEVGEYEVIGSLRRRGPYVRAGDREYLITGQVSTIGLEGGRPGDTWFASRDGGVLRGVEVPAGTFAKDKAAEDRAAAAETDTRPHRFDSLTGLPGLKAEPERMLALGQDPLDADPRLGVMSRSAKLLRTPARGPVRGPAAILEALRSRGVGVALGDDGELDVRARSLSLDDMAIIEKAEPLLRAHLAGKPLACSLRHKGQAPEAVTLVFPHRPICDAEHDA
jgi:hypothetical protein